MATGPAFRKRCTAGWILLTAAIVVGCGPRDRRGFPTSPPMGGPVRAQDHHPWPETLRGEIVGGPRIAPPDQQLQQTVRLTIRVDREPVEVDLGPGWFLEEQGLRYAPGEREVEVRGTRIRREDGSEAIEARTVRVGDRVIRLRDDEGRPLWEDEEKAPADDPPRPAGEPAPEPQAPE